MTALRQSGEFVTFDTLGSKGWQQCHTSRRIDQRHDRRIPIGTILAIAV